MCRPRAPCGTPSSLSASPTSRAGRAQSNKQIAASLHLSDATVHTHLINVYGKIGVNTRAGATLFALEHDLIQVGLAGKIDQTVDVLPIDRT